MTQLYPQKWFSPFQKLNTPKLQKDETLAMALSFDIEDTDNKKTIHNIFTVIRKDNKAIARATICHIKPEGFCKGHGANIAEYPIENEKELIKELRNFAEMAGTKLLTPEDNIKYKTKENNPITYLEVPKDGNNTKTVMKLIEDNTPNTEVSKMILIETLGLIEVSIEEIQKDLINNETNNKRIISPFSLSQETTPQESPEEKIEDLLNNNPKITTETKAIELEKKTQKANKEKELIAKYGKGRMLKLAKKLNYSGEIINKTKNKSHAN